MSFTVLKRLFLSHAICVTKRGDFFGSYLLQMATFNSYHILVISPFFLRFILNLSALFLQCGRSVLQWPRHSPVWPFQFHHFFFQGLSQCGRAAAAQSVPFSFIMRFSDLFQICLICSCRMAGWHHIYLISSWYLHRETHRGDTLGKALVPPLPPETPSESQLN